MDAIDQDLVRGLDLIRSMERWVPTNVVDHAHLKRIFDQQNDAAALRDAGLITNSELCRRCAVLRRDLSAEEDDIIAGMCLQNVVEKVLSDLPNASREEVSRYVIKRCTQLGRDDNMQRFLPYLMGEVRY